MANLAEKPQYPLNAVGNKGQQAFVGVHKIFFQGTTGLVATSYGVPGMVATRIATGSYGLVFDPTVGLDIIPGIQAPTGAHYTVNVSDVYPTSGTAKFQIARTGGGTVPSGSTVPTLMVQPQNPVSGTIVNLMIFDSTRVAY